MRLIALKPCSFGGKNFFIGDEIPVELVLNPQTQEKMGVLAIVEGEAADTGEASETIIIPDATLSIYVQTDKHTGNLEPTDEGIQNVFTVLIGKPTEAEAVINQMCDEDALILLSLSDSRKAVKAAAEARIKALSEGDA